MISLQQYINLNRNKIDGHVHLFDHNGFIDDEYNHDFRFNKIVGFLNIDFTEFDKYNNIVTLYDNFIKNYKNINRVILLACATNIEDIKSIHKKYSGIIKGFGELLCYDRYSNKQIGLKNIEFVRQIAEYNNSLSKPLPIYLHYSLESYNDYQKLYNLFTDFPNISFVLCHCGVPDKHEVDSETDFEMSHNLFKKLIELDNVYGDLTDAARPFYKKNLDKLYSLNINKLIIGTDFTPSHFRKLKQKEISKSEIDKIYSKFDDFNSLINSDNVIKKIFNL
jgi:hypothetical protein